MALDLDLPPDRVRDLNEMVSSAREATDYLKAISHEGRMIILCRLAHGEASVTELENILSVRQAAVSQQLARLRIEGIVNTRRDGKTIYYSIADNKTREMLDVIYKLFCKTKNKA